LGNGARPLDVDLAMPFQLAPANPHVTRRVHDCGRVATSPLHGLRIPNIAVVDLQVKALQRARIRSVANQDAHSSTHRQQLPHDVIADQTRGARDQRRSFHSLHL
jgi:hypothetical protein